MRIPKKQLFKFITLSFTILLSLSLEGCGNKDNKTKNEKKIETTAADASSDKHADDEAEGAQDDDTDVNTSISSGYYLSFGVLDENVVRNGAQRNETEVTVSDKKVIFPKGAIRSINIKSWSRKEQAYNPPKAKIIQYVDALESAEIVDEVPKDALKRGVKIETHILYLNSHGEFRTIGVTNFGNGYHEISVEKDDEKDFAKGMSIPSDAGEKYQQVFLRSMDAEKIVKKWIHWESQGEEGFDSIKSASLTVEGKVNKIELTEKQLKILKNYLKAEKKLLESPCGYENYFECTQNNGSKFHFSISADGESISTDKEVYEVDYPNNSEIVELFKNVYKKQERDGF